MPTESIGEHWFEPLAEHMGSAYLRYSFTKGTVNEIDFIVSQLDLQPGARILDVGCGPGRHSHELARRGFQVHGIDISQTFIDLATANAVDGSSFERMDARVRGRGSTGRSTRPDGPPRHHRRDALDAWLGRCGPRYLVVTDPEAVLRTRLADLDAEDAAG